MNPGGQERAGCGESIVRPVTMSRTAATIITKGNDRNSDSSAETVAESFCWPPEDAMPAQKSPQTIKGGLMSRDQSSATSLAAAAARRRASTVPTPR